MTMCLRRVGETRHEREAVHLGNAGKKIPKGNICRLLLTDPKQEGGASPSLRKFMKDISLRPWGPEPVPHGLSGIHLQVSSNIPLSARAEKRRAPRRAGISHAVGPRSPRIDFEAGSKALQRIRGDQYGEPAVILSARKTENHSLSNHGIREGPELQIVQRNT